MKITQADRRQRCKGIVRQGGNPGIVSWMQLIKMIQSQEIISINIVRTVDIPSEAGEVGEANHNDNQSRNLKQDRNQNNLAHVGMILSLILSEVVVFNRVLNSSFLQLK